MSDEHLTPWQKENLKYQALQKEKQKAEKAQLKSEKKEQAKNLLTLKSSEKKEKTDIEAEEKEEVESKPVKKSFINSLPKIKKEKRIQLLKKLTPLIIFFVIAFPITGYFLSPLSRLGKIEVVGNQHENTQDVIKTSGLILKEGLLVERKKLSNINDKMIKEFPRVQSTQTSFIFPNTFKISVKEKSEIAYVNEKGVLKIVLNDGTVIDEAVAQRNDSLPVLKNFESAKQIKRTIIEYQKLTAELKGLIQLIELTPTKSNKDFLTLTMSDGNQVKITIDDIDSKLHYYLEFSKEFEDKRVVDMEAGIYSYPMPE